MLATTAALYPEVLEFLSQEEIEARFARARRAYDLMMAGRLELLRDQPGYGFGGVLDADGVRIGFALKEATMSAAREKNVRLAICTKLVEMLEAGEIR